MLEDFSLRFSPDAKDVLLKAERIAISLKEMVNSNHLLLAIVTMKETIASEILEDLGVTLSSLNSAFEITPKNKNDQAGLPSQELKELLKQSFSLAFQSRSNEINPIHLLLAMAQNPRFLAHLTLRKVFIDMEKFKKLLFAQIEPKEEKEVSPQTSESMMPDLPFLDSDDTLFSDFPFQDLLKGFTGGEKQPSAPSSKTPTLDLFSTDLTKKARNNELDPVIGREKEIERVIQILNRRKKNNPVLIGEPGVGKTAIVEGLAQLVTQGKVPMNLANKRILALDLGLLVAGTKYRGEFEKRIKKIVEEIREDKNIILFIDEVHTVVGAGAAEGSIDAANIIKPPLARGELRLIGATTLDEYRQHIEKDAAFERRLQLVLVEEPATEENLKILKGVKNRYEKFHKVKIAEDALEAAVEFGQKYIHDRYFPDKAIDLIDEAASAKAVELQTTDFNKKTLDLEKEFKKIKMAKEKAVKNQDFDQAAKLKDKEDDIKTRIEKNEIKTKNKKFLGSIKRKDIAKVVSLWTGIPIAELALKEKIKYQELENKMKGKIIGQSEAVQELVRAIKRSSTGVRSEDRPIGSFIFLGPTGVGKTETARVLAEVLFGSKEALVKIDMSEFSEKHNVSRLVGAPPGYVGYEEGGKLTEQIRRKPYAVVLFDEIEKAHPEFFNILLQVLEDGSLTDAQGRKVSFKNTVIIMTSNLGVKELNEEASLGFSLLTKSRNSKDNFLKKFANAKKRIISKVKEFFPPEFINRLDKIIVFNPLTLDEVKQIVLIQIEEFKKRLSQKKIEIKIDQKAVKFLAEKGFNPQFGARPIRRLITREIEDKISEGLLLGKIKENSSISILKQVDKKHLAIKIDQKEKVKI